MKFLNIFNYLFQQFPILGTRDFYNRVIEGAIAVILILVSFKIVQVFVARIIKGHVTDQRLLLVRKLVRYTGFVVAIMTIFNRFGIDLSALLGAAGIAGVALGFASQTSVSNVISGLFLVSEKPFVLGDVIQVGDTTGIVESVDLLSIKLRTFDNRFVRIPNETLIKTNVINVTRYPIRRLDVWVTVGYTEDLERVKGVLEDLARHNVYALDNPEPLIVLDKFDASGINILCGLWFEKSNYLALKNSIMLEIKKRFEAERIEIPYQKIDIRLADSKTINIRSSV